MSEQGLVEIINEWNRRTLVITPAARRNLARGILEAGYRKVASPHLTVLPETAIGEIVRKGFEFGEHDVDMAIDKQIAEAQLEHTKKELGLK